MLSYLRTIAIGLDVTANAIIGGEPYQTISCRIGVSILGGTWASRVPWPNWLRTHFIEAVFETQV